MTPKEHVRALGRALHAVLDEHRLSARLTSLALDHHPAYLARALRGVMPLQVETVFSVFRHLGTHPADFFHELYPLGGEPLLRLEAGLGEPVDSEAATLVDRLWKYRRGEPLSPPEYRYRIGELLVAALQHAGVSQRSVSLKMGKSPGTLGQALRSSSELHFLQVFTVLEAARCDPGRLFFELFLQRSPDAYKRLRQARSVELLELALVRAAEGHYSRGAAQGSPRS